MWRSVQRTFLSTGPLLVSPALELKPAPLYFSHDCGWCEGHILYNLFKD